MPRRRRHVRRASAENAGRILFLRHRNNQPCICVQETVDVDSDASGNLLEEDWKWVLLKDLHADDFIKYRDTIVAYVKTLQEDARSMVNEGNRTKIIYRPSEDERTFLRQLFNNHLTDEEKKRYIIEYSHTIIGSGTCPRCFGITYGKMKCLHYDCPGMCDDCYEDIGEKCPLCEKEQILDCPICKEPKKANELCREKSCKECGHYVCWICLGKSYGMGKPVTKCPLCRKSWFSDQRVIPQYQVVASGGAGNGHGFLPSNETLDG